MNIIIGGFGRSGTTWLSDIVSKSLGGLILFEPFHPCVYHDAKDFVYSTDRSKDLKEVTKYIDKVLNTLPRNPWLLRNHLNDPLEKHDEDFIKYIWDNSEVLGFKTIRANHCLSSLCTSLPHSKVLYIYRHPLSVLASINKRINFWKEYDWETHKQLFFERAFKCNSLELDTIEHLKAQTCALSSKNEYTIAMWAVSFLISYIEVQKSNGALICYEDLYQDPYACIKRVYEEMNIPTPAMHPSYFFTPSMTTLKTVHHSSEMIASGLDNIFWKSEFSSQESKALLELCYSILQVNSDVIHLASEKNYF